MTAVDTGARTTSTSRTDLVVLEVENLGVRYGGAYAVGGVSFDVRRGEVLTVLGVNGAGKSSLARACSGLVPTSRGRIRLDGTDVTGWRADQIRKAGLVYLPEGRGVFPNLSVEENLRLAVRESDDKQRALGAAYEYFPILAQRRKQRAGSLSGGEQQMLSLARALAVEPKIAIVDEPSLGLAPKIIDLVFESLQRAKKAGMTMIVIEQFAHRALALSDSAVILRRGHIVWSGPATTSVEVITSHYFG